MENGRGEVAERITLQSLIV